MVPIPLLVDRLDRGGQDMISTICHDINVTQLQGEMICLAAFLIICLVGLLFVKLEKHLEWAEKRDARKAYVKGLYDQAEAYGKAPQWPTKGQ